ncbi:MAG: hypothetical protein E5V49_01990 [Mesorhizobium sp.]|nr:hypothetical protein EN848_07630 [bacterium M00.F.Ca.ET.205.01.1.1]TGU53918.1 hypothetical protein EN795_12055 [bacterium M00.F.Ca.ET.152.01.1.1]TGV37416.1 hypothetical protein EN829_012080 [Mesorhizobium sp. M00.F.Ca.ET.186.01.1.1]TGZ41223.1 hypothetical protein EN805_20770 [bacterium M00.F.Ca.ET.162.01.1.1]TIW62217.1 MAG: hypothetical protein E5V48_05510 [Mesorhizobium sp.]
MTNISTFKRLSLAAAIVVSALGSISVPSSAFANGTLPSGTGGSVCKGVTDCLLLNLDCKGKYIDGTDSSGTVYGKCTQTSQVAPRAKIKLAK